MSYNKKVLLSLLLGYGLFSSQAMAEEYISNISEESTSPLIQLVKEKESEVSDRELLLWQGVLSRTDEKLIDSLVKRKLYNFVNAEIFVRSLKESEVKELSGIINENTLSRARQAVAATVE